MRVNQNDQVDQRALPPTTRLLDVLRDQLGLTGTKEACARGECGACTVLVDGRPVLACITLACRVSGHVETIEGLAEEAADLRASFARRSAFQCGFCTPGQIVRGLSLLRGGLPTDDGRLREALSGNICRCTGYQGIVQAIRDTAATRAGVAAGEAAGTGPERLDGGGS
jgi:aerobic-type carbon monoxide dehydrogenase small subunit (CoxS/CutS family)